MLGVAISEQRFGRAYETSAPVPAEPISLEWRSPGRLDDEWPGDEPQILGEPRWVQAPERMFCRVCHDEMVFVATMATMPGLPITNESGCLYHFACNRCRVIRVSAQWT